MTAEEFYEEQTKHLNDPKNLWIGPFDSMESLPMSVFRLVMKFANAYANSPKQVKE